MSVASNLATLVARFHLVELVAVRRDAGLRGRRSIIRLVGRTGNSHTVVIARKKLGARLANRRVPFDELVDGERLVRVGNFLTRIARLRFVKLGAVFRNARLSRRWAGRRRCRSWRLIGASGLGDRRRRGALGRGNLVVGYDAVRVPHDDVGAVRPHRRVLSKRKKLLESVHSTVRLKLKKITYPKNKLLDRDAPTGCKVLTVVTRVCSLLVPLAVGVDARVCRPFRIWAISLGKRSADGQLSQSSQVQKLNTHF